MKRNLLILLVLVVALFTVACSTNAKDVVVETQEETNTDVTESTPSTEEQEVEEVEEAKEESVELLAWPTDFIENVPVLEGEISKIRENEENQKFIGLKSISYEDATAYIGKLKEAGFTEDSAEYIAEYNINFKARDKNGNFVKLRWSNSGDAGIDMVKPE